MAIGFWFAFGVLGVLVTPLGAQPTHSDMLVGSERCTWGPAYWCSGLKQSAHCGATTHCIRSVWESNPYPEDDDEVCTKHRVNFSLFKMCSIIYFIKANILQDDQRIIVIAVVFKNIFKEHTAS